MATRKPGFYWVRSHGEWVVAQFDEGALWWVTGWDLPIRECDFAEIGGRIVSPEETDVRGQD